MLHPMLAFFASISCSTTSRPPFLALFFLRPLPTSALLSVPLSFPASVRAHVALLVRGLVAALLSPPPRSLLHHLPPPPTRARARIHLTTCPRSLLLSPLFSPSSSPHTHTSAPFPTTRTTTSFMCVLRFRGSPLGGLSSTFSSSSASGSSDLRTLMPLPHPLLLCMCITYDRSRSTLLHIITFRCAEDRSGCMT